MDVGIEKRVTSVVSKTPAKSRGSKTSDANVNGKEARTFRKQYVWSMRRRDEKIQGLYQMSPNLSPRSGHALQGIVK